MPHTPITYKHTHTYHTHTHIPTHTHKPITHTHTLTPLLNTGVPFPHTEFDYKFLKTAF